MRVSPQSFYIPNVMSCLYFVRVQMVDTLVLISSSTTVQTSRTNAKPVYLFATSVVLSPVPLCAFTHVFHAEMFSGIVVSWWSPWTTLDAWVSSWTVKYELVSYKTRRWLRRQPLGV